MNVNLKGLAVCVLIAGACFVAGWKLNSTGRYALSSDGVYLLDTRTGEVFEPHEDSDKSTSMWVQNVIPVKESTAAFKTEIDKKIKKLEELEKENAK